MTGAFGNSEVEHLNMADTWKVVLYFLLGFDVYHPERVTVRETPSSELSSVSATETET